MDRERAGNIYKMPGKTLVGTHKDGVLYDTSGNEAGFFGEGHVSRYKEPVGTIGRYENGVIYNAYNTKIGAYRRGDIFNEYNTVVGAYTGDDDGGAAGGFIFFLNG